MNIEAHIGDGAHGIIVGANIDTMDALRQAQDMVHALRDRVDFFENISCETCVALPTCPIYQAARGMRTRYLTSNQFGCNWYYHSEPAQRGGQ